MEMHAYMMSVDSSYYKPARAQGLFREVPKAVRELIGDGLQLAMASGPDAPSIAAPDESGGGSSSSSSEPRPGQARPHEVRVRVLTARDRLRLLFEKCSPEVLKGAKRFDPRRADALNRFR